MTILHIERTEPDDTVRVLIREISKGQDSKEVVLFTGETDYHRLIEEIFSSDRVISWW
jgi:hypothetical protein